MPFRPDPTLAKQAPSWRPDPSLASSPTPGFREDPTLQPTKPADPFAGDPFAFMSKSIFGAGTQLFANALGIAGEGIGLGATALVAPDRFKQVIASPTEQFRKMLPFLGQFVDKPAGQVAEKVGGQALSAAATYGSFASGTGLAPVDQALAGIAKAPGAAGVAERVVTRGAQAGLTSAASAAGQQMNAGASAADVGKSAAISGGLGFGLGALMQGGIEGANALLKGQPERLYNSALGVKRADIKAGKSPVAELIRQGKVGTLGSLKNAEEEVAGEMQTQINDALASSDRNVRPTDFFKNIAEGMNEKYQTKFTGAQIQQFVTNLDPRLEGLAGAKTWSLPQANLFRQTLDQTLGDRAFIAGVRTFDKGVAMDTTNLIRSTVKDLAPETRPLFKDWETAIQTTKAIENKLAGAGNNMIGVGDIGATIAGGTVAGGPGAAAAALGRRLLESPLAKTAAAVGLDRILHAMTLLNDLPGGTRATVIRLITDEVTKPRK